MKTANQDILPKGTVIQTERERNNEHGTHKMHNLICNKCNVMVMMTSVKLENRREGKIASKKKKI